MQRVLGAHEGVARPILSQSFRWLLAGRSPPTSFSSICETSHQRERTNRRRPSSPASLATRAAVFLRDEKKTVLVFTARNKGLNLADTILLHASLICFLSTPALPLSPPPAARRLSPRRRNGSGFLCPQTLHPPRPFHHHRRASSLATECLLSPPPSARRPPSSSSVGLQDEEALPRPPLRRW